MQTSTRRIYLYHVNVMLDKIEDKIHLSFLTGGQNNFVVMADPNHLEAVLRAEGKYPDRDTNFSPNLEWIITKLNYPPAFAIK